MAHAVSIASTQAALNQHMVQFAPEVRQVFRVGLEFETLPEIAMVSADHTYTSQNVAVSSLIQPYQARFTPNNTESWDGVSNVLRPIKLDLSFSEEQLMKFYDKWRNEWFEAGKNPMEWSYPRFITENMIAPVWKEEINQLAWLGEFVEPTPGTAGAMLESCDGYKKAITDAISAGKLVPIASGAYTSSNIRTKVQEFMMALPDGVRGRKGVLLMSDTHAREHFFDFQGDFATSTWSSLQEMGGQKVNGFDVQIKGLMAMEGSDRWIFLPQNSPNMIFGTRRGYPSYPSFIMDHDLYNLNMKAVIYRFYGFEYWDNLYVNDQA